MQAIRGRAAAPLDPLGLRSRQDAHDWRLEGSPYWVGFSGAYGDDDGDLRGHHNLYIRCCYNLYNRYCNGECRGCGWECRGCGWECSNSTSPLTGVTLHWVVSPEDSERLPQLDLSFDSQRSTALFWSDKCSCSRNTCLIHGGRCANMGSRRPLCES